MENLNSTLPLYTKHDSGFNADVSFSFNNMHDNASFCFIGHKKSYFDVDEEQSFCDKLDVSVNCSSLKS